MQRDTPAENSIRSAMRMFGKTLIPVVRALRTGLPVTLSIGLTALFLTVPFNLPVEAQEGSSTPTPHMAGLSATSTPALISGGVQGSGGSPPPTPGRPSVTGVSHDSISLSWGAVSGAGHYDVQYRNRDAGGPGKPGSWLQTNDISGTSITFSGLSSSTRYEFRVRAGKGEVHSDWSPNRYGTTIAVPPSLTLPDPQDRWLTRGVSASFTLPLASGGTSPYTYSVSGLPAGLSFTASNRTVGGAPTVLGASTVTYTVTDNASASRQQTFTITVTASSAPSRPARPSVTAVSQNSITLKWGAVTGATHYDTRYRNRDAGGRGVPGSWSQTDDITGTTKTFSGLTPGTRYEFEVRAGNAVGDSIWSLNRYGTTTSPPPPAPATTPTPTPTSTPTPATTPTPTQTPTTPTPMQTPTPVPGAPTIWISRVIPGTTNVYVKLSWSPPRTSWSKLTLKWKQKASTKWTSSPELSSGTNFGYELVGRFTENSDFDIKVVGETTVGGAVREIESASKSFKTHRSPQPMVTHLYGKDVSDSYSLENFNGRLMNVVTVDLGIQPEGRVNDFLDFLIEAPSGTGLEVKNSLPGTCDWNSNAAPTKSGFLKANGKFYLARCGIGTGSAKLTIRASELDNNVRYGVTYAEVSIPRSWHQRDNVVKYSVQTLPPTLTPTPTPTPPPVHGTGQEIVVPRSTPTPVPTPDFRAAIPTAAAVWGTSPVTFCTGTGCGASNADGRSIVIQVVTPRPNPPRPTPTFPCGDNSLACVAGWWNGDEHIGNQTMYIVHPLHFYQRQGGVDVLKKYQWIDDISLVEDNLDVIYLPAVLAHEFGHAAGLGHSSVSGDVMYTEDYTQSHPTANDRKALQKNYEGHTSH